MGEAEGGRGRDAGGLLGARGKSQRPRGPAFCVNPAWFRWRVQFSCFHCRTRAGLGEAGSVSTRGLGIEEAEGGEGRGTLALAVGSDRGRGTGEGSDRGRGTREGFRPSVIDSDSGLWPPAQILWPPAQILWPPGLGLGLTARTRLTSLIMMPTWHTRARMLCWTRDG